MKKQIEIINRQIEERRVRLKEKAERYLSSIIVPNPTIMRTSANKGSSVPPISYILYGLAGISAASIFMADSKLLCTGMAAACAFGGYKFSQRVRPIDGHVINSNMESVSSVKTNVTSKVLESVKKITQEWEEFMEVKQKEVQSLIDATSMEESQKGTLQSKVFIFEVIDIRISVFSDMINSATNTTEIKQKINAYKIMLLNAIDNAVDKQIARYQSLMC